MAVTPRDRKAFRMSRNTNANPNFFPSFQRKLRMAQLSTGGFIVLPGGFGTFEEVMEMVTWNQLRIHRRPVVVLNGKNTVFGLSSARKLILEDVQSTASIPRSEIKSKGPSLKGSLRPPTRRSSSLSILRPETTRSKIGGNGVWKR